MKDEVLGTLERAGDGRNVAPRAGSLAGEGAAQRVANLEGAFPAHPASPALALTAPGPTHAHPTYYGLPVLKEPVWIWAVPAYFYVGGVSGAASVLGVAAELVDRERLGGLAGRCRWVGALGDALGGALLIADLGRPERFLHMMRVLRPTSPMSVGSWVLAVSGACNGAAALLVGQRGVLGRAGDAASVAAGLLGLPLAGYTAVLLNNTAVPLWQRVRHSLPLLFMSSAVVSAASLLALAPHAAPEERALRVYGVAGGAAALAATWAVERQAARSTAIAQPLHRGLSGTLWGAAKACTAAGLVLSLLPGRPRWKTVAASALSTLGSLGMRFAVLHAGKASARDPQATLRSQREGMGAAGSPPPLPARR